MMTYMTPVISKRSSLPPYIVHPIGNALRLVTPQAESEDEALDTEVGGSPFWFCWSFRICPGIGILYGYDMVIIWLYICMYEYDR
jgi:hypothetical protein